MSTTSEVTIQALEYIVKTLPVGIHLVLLCVLWALVSGAVLNSRSAVFPALQTLGLSAVQIRRSSQAVRDGASSSDDLVSCWRAWVAADSSWQPLSYAGYPPLAVDNTALWRPRSGTRSQAEMAQRAATLQPPGSAGLRRATQPIQGQEA